MMNAMKTKAFFENARLLQKAFGIAPLMYGSLGLSYLTGEDLHADDIDILIPGELVSERWGVFKRILEENGYRLIDEHEHEFEKDEIHYAYAKIEELESFAGISVRDIGTHENDGVSFRLLTLKEYLAVYTASSKDGYRINVREKKDLEKITFIRKCLLEKR